ncbi:hypothetical protein C4D60_Mb08t00630 [Musa balbisiana]|uniref:glycerophosphodiester phosphodiesterase n=1 Tax=Musa balbisiana TaxID=52838 RepID=A0A4S8K0H0_MUSBA|nr:hypothetical protein C4D60_Mb08t00630 [Musa balbisiana]
MTLKAVHVMEVPRLHQVAETPSAAALLPRAAAARGFVVVGHRGKGMNALESTDLRMRAVKENSLLSFNRAALFPIDFVEFDVQGKILEKHVTDLYLEEFLSYGPQREPGKVGKSLLRKTDDGRVLKWNVDDDDSLCTLQEAFEKIDSRLGFNIELKFIDHAVYLARDLTHALEAVLKVVYEHANGRPIIFSTFQPDAAQLQLLRKLQTAYPASFPTRNPSAVSSIKASNLSLLTYGRLNNVPEAVYMQHLMGIDGVIVDLVEEITEAVSDFIAPTSVAEEHEGLSDAVVEARQVKVRARPNFSQRELSFLLKLIPELKPNLA